MQKRFIAGAVCPKCGAMDCLVVFTQNDQNHRECVECGFSDVMHFQQSPRELETRVNVTEAEKAAQTQVVKILPSQQD